MGKRKNILVVEDEKLNLKILIQYLKELNCSLISLDTGEKAIEFYNMIKKSNKKLEGVKYGEYINN